MEAKDMKFASHEENGGTLYGVWCPTCGVMIDEAPNGTMMESLCRLHAAAKGHETWLVMRCGIDPTGELSKPILVPQAERINYIMSDKEIAEDGQYRGEQVEEIKGGE